VFGSRPGVIELADPDPLALAGTVEALLDDPARRERQAAAARRFVAGMTWTATADQIEQATRRWLGRRWEEHLRDAPSDPALAEARAHLG
jgi:hypothetical protein